MSNKIVQWEYVISALSHTGLDHKSIFENVEVLDKINDMFGAAQNKHNHKVSLLFNAFTEKNHGKKLLNYSKVYNVHSDSGGLQVVTLGKKIDADMRKKIYETQAKYSDVAMSFDEMPVAVDERSTKLDTNARRFDKDNFESMSRQSGKNLLEQINYFLDEKTKCKPLVILHGNDIDWYQRNLNYILEEIPETKWKYIGGIACGSGAMGFGTLENIERSAVMAFIDAPKHLKKKYHVLGVGSLGRMMPLVALLRNGVFDKDVHISYDSSSLTISFTMGFHHFDDWWCKSKLTKQYDETFLKMYDDVSKKAHEIFGGDVTIDREDLHKLMCLSKGAGARGDHPEKFILNAAVLLSSVMNFNKQLHRLTTEENYYNDYVTTQNKMLSSLSMIKSKQDFTAWKRDCGRFFDSQRVSDGTESSLEEFFA